MNPPSFPPVFTWQGEIGTTDWTKAFRYEVYAPDGRLDAPHGWMLLFVAQEEAWAPLARLELPAGCTRERADAAAVRAFLHFARERRWGAPPDDEPPISGIRSGVGCPFEVLDE